MESLQASVQVLQLHPCPLALRAGTAALLTAKSFLNLCSCQHGRQVIYFLQGTLIRSLDRRGRQMHLAENCSEKFSECLTAALHFSSPDISPDLGSSKQPKAFCLQKLLEHMLTPLITANKFYKRLQRVAPLFPVLGAVHCHSDCAAECAAQTAHTPKRDAGHQTGTIGQYSK